jgi:predicted PurR-regulated permease PerM
MPLTRRQQVLGGVLIAVVVLTLAILWRVLGAIFFAITVAYVLYPVRRRLVRRGASDRVAATVATVVGFTAAVALVVPLIYTLYARRSVLVDLIERIPTEETIALFGYTYVVDVSQLLDSAQDALVSLAVGIARASPVLALKAFLFVFLVYALLYGGRNLHGATRRLVPPEYHDIVMAMHHRVRDTLYALYVLQAATAFATFCAALALFLALGYGQAVTLAILAGILQFIPVLGPSILIVAIAAFEVMAGNIASATIVTILGLIFVGFLPDAIIRPRLASITTGMPASLYFIGFTGGTLSLGVVGIIAGPLVVALLVEAAELVTTERNNHQSTLDAVPDVPPRDGGEGEGENDS